MVYTRGFIEKQRMTKRLTETDRKQKTERTILTEVEAIEKPDNNKEKRRRRNDKRINSLSYRKLYRIARNARLA